MPEAVLSTSLNEYGLTDRQEAFSRNYVFSGGIGTKAAKAAGYATKSAHAAACTTLQKPKVQERIMTLTREYMGEFAPSCVKVLAELAVSAQSESIRHSAATTILDRTGYRTPILIDVLDHRNQQDIDAELAVLLGLSDVIEGELAQDQAVIEVDSDTTVD